MPIGIKFKWQNPNVKSNPKPQCQNVFQNDQLLIFFPLCIFTSVGCVWINGWAYIFQHLSFDIHLKFACPVKSVSYFTGGLWPLSFKFILFTSWISVSIWILPKTPFYHFPITPGPDRLLLVFVLQWLYLKIRPTIFQTNQVAPGQASIPLFHHSNPAKDGICDFPIGA